MKDTLYLPIFMLVAGLIASYIGISAHLQSSNLQQNGVVVSSLDTAGNTNVIKNGSHSIREIAPKFETSAGAVYSCRAAIDDEMMAKLQTHPIVEVRYLADDPEVCEMIGGKSKRKDVPLVLGILSVLGSLVAIFKGYKK